MNVDKVGRPLTKPAINLKLGETFRLGPDEDDEVVIVLANDVARKLTLNRGRTMEYDELLEVVLYYPAVNVWSADAYGNGEHTGTRWTLYVDDDEVGALTHIIEAGGPVPEGSEYHGIDDDWLYGQEAWDFLATAIEDEEGDRG